MIADFFGDALVCEQSLIRCRWTMVSFDDLGAIPKLFLQLEEWLKKIYEQAHRCVKLCEFVRGFQTFKPAIATIFRTIAPFFCSTKA
jgi:hypothetical protein